MDGCVIIWIMGVESGLLIRGIIRSQAGFYLVCFYHEYSIFTRIVLICSTTSIPHVDCVCINQTMDIWNVAYCVVCTFP